MMKHLFLCTAVAVLAVLSVSAVSVDKDRPVTQIVNLLRDMQKELEQDQREDEEIYKKFDCWCNKNKGETDEAVENASKLLDKLHEDVESYSSSNGSLKTDIAKVEREEETLDEELKALIEQYHQFKDQMSEQDKELSLSIQAVKAAIALLSKHHPDATALVHVKKVLGQQLEKHADKISPTSGAKITAFISADHLERYQPQSGEVLGFLKGMLADFEGSLSRAGKEFVAQDQNLKKLRSVKEEQLQSKREYLANKKAEQADTAEKLSQAKEEIEETMKSLTADQSFLTKLHLNCQSTDTEHESRVKSRKEELVAIADAIHILGSDDARDTVKETFSPSLLQVTHKAKAKLDGFERVKKAIDSMVEDLINDGKMEAKHVTQCHKDLHKDDLDMTEVNSSIQALEVSMADLNDRLAGTETSLNQTLAEIDEKNAQVEKSKKERAEEKAEALKQMHNQRETEQLLLRAIRTLEGVYRKRKTVPVPAESFMSLRSLVKSREPEAEPSAPDAKHPAAPKGFDKYQSHQGGDAVLALLEHILSDAKDLHKKTQDGEAEAAETHQQFLLESEKDISELRRTVVSKKGRLSGFKSNLAETDETYQQAHSDLQIFHDRNTHNRKVCDFFLEHEKERNAKRDEEIEALRTAKAVLSGMQADSRSEEE